MVVIGGSKHEPVRKKKLNEGANLLWRGGGREVKKLAKVNNDLHSLIVNAKS